MGEHGRKQEPWGFFRSVHQAESTGSRRTGFRRRNVARAVLCMVSRCPLERPGPRSHRGGGALPCRSGSHQRPAAGGRQADVYGDARRADGSRDVVACPRSFCFGVHGVPVCDRRSSGGHAFLRPLSTLDIPFCLPGRWLGASAGVDRRGVGPLPPIHPPWSAGRAGKLRAGGDMICRGLFAWPGRDGRHAWRVNHPQQAGCVGGTKQLRAWALALQELRCYDTRVCARDD